MSDHLAGPEPHCAPHTGLRGGERALLPERDPFYRPPSGFEDVAAGTVLRSRDVEVAFLGLIPQRVTATQLLYRSTDLHGEPEPAVTTVLLPANPRTDGPCPVLSYQCAIDAMASRCFPSYALRRDTRTIGAFVQSEYLLVAAALAQGWAVCVPDHEGCRGMWGAPYEPGFRILDGLRAAFNSPRIGLSPTAPVGIWGYSGGGLASAWAAEVHEAYAPELNVAGTVLGSPVVDPESVARRLNGSFWAGLPALMIAALIHVFPEAQRVVDEHATDEGRALLRALADMTTAEAILRFRHVDIGDFVDMTSDELWELPEVRHIFESTKLGQAVPRAPVLVIQAVHDNLISVRDVDALVQKYSQGGASVTYHRDRFCEHLLLHPLSAPASLRWLRDRFAGRPLRSHLERTTRPALLDPSCHLGVAKLALVTAKVIAGRRIGRQADVVGDAR